MVASGWVGAGRVGVVVGVGSRAADAAAEGEVVGFASA